MQSEKIKTYKILKFFADNDLDTLSETSCEVVEEIKRDQLSISIDKDPLNDNNSSNVSYDLKHREENILPMVPRSKPQHVRKESRKVCYNCGENHTFRQCKLPQNVSRIQSEMMRYRVVSEMVSAPKAANQRGLKCVFFAIIVKYYLKFE